MSSSTAKGRCGSALAHSHNRNDVTTFGGIVRLMEEKHGQARRIWVMDRGMVCEENITFLRERGAQTVLT
jgi:hypothetical protein